MKEFYTKPKIEIELFKTEDLITASVDLGENENGAEFPKDWMNR